MSTANWIDLEGTNNTRDLGGLATASGGRIAPGRLIRSDNLQDLTPADVHRLIDDLGVSTIVDLRRTQEVLRNGPGPLQSQPSVTVHHHSLYPEDSTESGVPDIEDDHVGSTTREQIAAAAPVSWKQDDLVEHEDMWTSHYLTYLRMRPDSIIAALRDIAAAPGAVVVHCAAGKDRTGTVVALALHLCEVPDEQIVADYAVSAERVPALLERLKRTPAYAGSLDHATVDNQSPKADTMVHLLAAIRSVYGDALSYLAAHGWTSADTQELRRKLLEGSPDA